LSTFRLLRQAQAAADFHVLAVHLHAVQWQTLLGVGLNPEDWRWNLKDGMAVPVSADMQPVPEDMSVIACKCKTTTKKPMQLTDLFML